MSLMKRTYSVGSCPIGEQLGHSSYVVTFEEGNESGHPAGSGFCLHCGFLPAISAHPAVSATLQLLASTIKKIPRCAEDNEHRAHYRFLDELPLLSALVVVSMHDLDTYISPGTESEPDFFAGKPINPRLLSIAQELLKIGFLVLDLSSNRQDLNRLVLRRPRRLAQENNEEPIAIEISLQAPSVQLLQRRNYDIFL